MAETDKPAIDSIEQTIIDRLHTTYHNRISHALENLYIALADGGPSAWIDRGHKADISAVVSAVQAKCWPSVKKRKVQDFVTVYEKLLVEFPHLLEQARQDG